MRITIVTGPFLPLPPGPGGGVEILWDGLARHFASRGHQVTVVCRGYPGQNDDETIDGVRFLRRTRMGRPRRMAVTLLRDMAYSLRILPLLPRADIISTNVFWLPALLPMLRPKAGKVVVNVHRFPKRQLGLYKAATRIATCSDVIRDAIGEQAPGLLSRTRVFPNPIDVHTFHPPAMPRRFDGPLKVLYTGRLHPEKGLHLLIDAFAQLAREVPEVRLTIMGPWRVDRGGGGEVFIRSLRERAAGLRVEVCDPIYDRAALADAYRDAHCYTYPTCAEKGEALPAAPLEAMATGLVPVVSDLACFRGYLKPGLTGYIFDHRAADPAASLCRALKQVLTEPLATAEISEHAISMAADYSYEKVATRYLDDFQTLLQ